MSGRRKPAVHVLDELYLPNCPTPRACEEFHKRAQKYFAGGAVMQVTVYGDATAQRRQTASAGATSDWEAVRDFFAHNREYKAVFKYGPSNPAVRDRVAAVNGMLRNSLGETHLFLDPRCEKLIRDFERVVWSAGTAELDQDTDHGLTHLSDALGYYIEPEFGARRNGGPRPTRVN
jgi:hypothetical protein